MCSEKKWQTKLDRKKYWLTKKQIKYFIVRLLKITQHYISVKVVQYTSYYSRANINNNSCCRSTYLPVWMGCTNAPASVTTRLLAMYQPKIVTIVGQLVASIDMQPALEDGGRSGGLRRGSRGEWGALVWHLVGSCISSKRLDHLRSCLRASYTTTNLFFEMIISNSMSPCFILSLWNVKSSRIYRIKDNKLNNRCGLYLHE